MEIQRAMHRCIGSTKGSERWIQFWISNFEIFKPTLADFSVKEVMNIGSSRTCRLNTSDFISEPRWAPAFMTSFLWLNFSIFNINIIEIHWFMLHFGSFHLMSPLAEIGLTCTYLHVWKEQKWKGTGCHGNGAAVAISYSACPPDRC